MNNGRIFIDRFSAGLDDLTAKEARCTVTVLKTLDRIKRFSVFEATANAPIARMMTRVFRDGLVENLGGGYPWTDVELTQAGRDLIAASERAASANQKGE